MLCIVWLNCYALLLEADVIKLNPEVIIFHWVDNNNIELALTFTLSVVYTFPLIKVYLELELPTHGGGEILAQIQMELNWFMLEELVERNLMNKEEQLTEFVYLKTLIILLIQQESHYRV